MNDDHNQRADTNTVPPRRTWQRPVVRRIDPRAAENMPGPAMTDGQGTFGS